MESKFKVDVMRVMKGLGASAFGAEVIAARGSTAFVTLSVSWLGLSRAGLIMFMFTGCLFT